MMMTNSSPQKCDDNPRAACSNCYFICIFFLYIGQIAVIFCTALPVWAAVEKNEKRTITQEAICMMLGCNMLTESPSDFVSPMFAVCYRCVL